MDTSDSAISFNQDGICDHCHNYFSSVKPKWETLLNDQAKKQSLIGQIKQQGRNNDFDCIIGMSGGIDSSYLVYLAKEQYGLNPLVFHVDAGWNSQIAVNNIERMVDGLGLDLFTEVFDR